MAASVSPPATLTHMAASTAAKGLPVRPWVSSIMLKPVVTLSRTPMESRTSACTTVVDSSANAPGTNSTKQHAARCAGITSALASAVGARPRTSRFVKMLAGIV